MSDRLAAVLRAAPGGGEPPWDAFAAGSIALPFAVLDADPRIHWDGAALLIQARRFTPVHVDWLHRYVIAEPIGGDCADRPEHRHRRRG